MLEEMRQPGGADVFVGSAHVHVGDEGHHRRLVALHDEELDAVGQTEFSDLARHVLLHGRRCSPGEQHQDQGQAECAVSEPHCILLAGILLGYCLRSP